MDKKTERLIHLIKQAQEQYSEDYLVITIPGFISKKFIAYCAMKEDIELILEYIKNLRQKPAAVIKSSLTYSLISLYGKCFTDASKNNFPKLESNDLFQLNDGNLETHNFIIELRHQFIAHRGDTESEVCISYLLVPKKDKIENSQIKFGQLKQVAFSEDDINRIEKLLKFLLEKVMDKIQKSGQKVHDGMLNIFTPEQLSLMLINNAK
jgi:hypothetical protein